MCQIYHTRTGVKHLVLDNACRKYDIDAVSAKVIRAWMALLARRKAAKMTPEQRSEHGRKMALARWGKAKGETK